MTKDLTFVQKKIFNKCLKMEPAWKGSEVHLVEIIRLADTNKDGHKRVIIDGKVYLVPIEDIICKGIKGSEVSLKYKLEP